MREQHITRGEITVDQPDRVDREQRVGQAVGEVDELPTGHQPPPVAHLTSTDGPAVRETCGVVGISHSRPALIAAAFVATIGLAACSSSGSPHPQAGPASTPAVSSTPDTTPSPSPSTPATTPSTPPARPPTLKIGSKGAAVTELQQQLTALGYWVGKADGHFGTTTQQAVFALQKASGLARSGTVNAKTRAALDAGKRPTAKSTTGKVIEINLKADLLMFVTNGHVDYTLNTSTGGGYVYYDKGERNVAITPKGHFTTYRVIDAPHRSSLGLLIRPRYFHDGFAIHGDSSVPAYPVSHGCVRVSNAAINWIWSKNLDPIGTKVWIY
jgi:lipoprotein-anchoring transpeptidase ErfK/SrfK